MYLTAVNAAGRAHVGDYTQECAIFEQTESVYARLAANDGISAALEGGLNVSHDCRLVLDQEHGQRLGSEGW
jgi:hypothetical protein